MELRDRTAGLRRPSGVASPPQPMHKGDALETVVRQHLHDEFMAGRGSAPAPAREAAWANKTHFQMKVNSAIECPVHVYRYVTGARGKGLPCWLSTEKAPELARAQRVLDRLLPVTPRAGQTVVLHLLQSLKPNAVAFGANKMGIMDSLLKRVRSDDELAFVLAHELAHDVHRDNPGLARVTTGAARLLLPLILRGNLPDRAAQIYDQELQRLQRQMETEADAKAIAWMRAAGFNPEGAVSFLRTLDQSEKPHSRKLPGNHPPTSERIKTLSAMIAGDR